MLLISFSRLQFILIVGVKSSKNEATQTIKANAVKTFTDSNTTHSVKEIAYSHTKQHKKKSRRKQALFEASGGVAPG